MNFTKKLHYIFNVTSKRKGLKRQVFPLIHSRKIKYGEEIPIGNDREPKNFLNVRLELYTARGWLFTSCVIICK